MKTRSILISSLVLAALPLASNAISTTYSDRDAWESAVGSWIDVDLASQVAEGDPLSSGSSLNLPFGQTVSFDKDLEGRQVPGTFATWSNGNEPRVLLTDDTETEVVGVFSSAIRAFGLEMQPDDQTGLFLMALTLSDGSTVSQSVEGNGGASFFGWISDSPAHVVSMNLSMDAAPGDQGFAFGRMVQGAVTVPEAASTGMLLLLSLTGLGIIRHSVKNPGPPVLRRPQPHDSPADSRPSPEAPDCAL